MFSINQNYRITKLVLKTFDLVDCQLLLQKLVSAEIRGTPGPVNSAAGCREYKLEINIVMTMKSHEVSCKVQYCYDGLLIVIWYSGKQNTRHQ